MGDGAAILKNGQPMTVEEIVDRLTAYQSENDSLRDKIEELEEPLSLAQEPCRDWYKQGQEGGWEIYSTVKNALTSRSRR